MAEKPSETVNDEGQRKIRQALLEDTVIRPLKFLPQIEQASDNIYKMFLDTEDGKSLGVLEFRKWTHEEGSSIYKLPFYSKLYSKQSLTDEENEALIKLEVNLVRAAILDGSKWESLFSNDVRILHYVFDTIANISGASEQFNNDLDLFMNSTAGFAYGFLWFTVMRKTPSEVAKLPETDVKAVNSWFQKYYERLNK